MAFLNTLGKKIGSAAETTASKAKEVAETTKLKNRISDQEKQMEKNFLEIGKNMFILERDNPESPVAELCTNILSCQNKIEELLQEIENIKRS